MAARRSSYAAGSRKQANLGVPRWFLPLAVGIVSFGFVWVGQEPPGLLVDFDYLWAGGQAVWQGEDPYAAVQALVEQGRLKAPYYYPAAAAVLMAPFGALSRHLAVSLFTALGMALLCYSVTGWRRWIVVSAPALQAVLFGQWSPWLTAAIGLPWLGFVWAAKPNIGLPLFATWPSRIAMYGGLAVVVLSFLLMPTWPASWLDALQRTPHYEAPVTRFGGFVLLLAFLRWRQPEARMLGLLALIPHTTTLYEQIPLLLIPQTKRTFAGFMGLSWLAALCGRFLVGYEGMPQVEALRAGEILDRLWPYFLVLVYLPALYLVLWPYSPKKAETGASTGCSTAALPDES